MYNRWEVVAFAVIMMLFEAPIVWGFGVRYGWRRHIEALQGMAADVKRRKQLDLNAEKEKRLRPDGPKAS